MGKIVYKWNPKKHEYNPFIVPREWVTPQISSNMNALINCISCGKQIRFGDGYGSRIYHDRLGLSYSVCEECFEKELKEEAGEEVQS